MEVNVFAVKRISRLLFGTLAIVICCFHTSASEGTLRTLGLSAAQWPPYIYYHNNSLTGRDYDLLRQVLAKMQYGLQSRPLPEKRVGAQIARGGIDIVAGAARNTDRERNNLFSIPYRREKIGFAYLPQRSKTFSGKTLQQLLNEGCTLALNTSGWYGKRFAETIATRFSGQLIHLDSVERRLALLKKQRVDLILDDTEVLKFNAAAEDIELVISDEIIQQQNVHFMFSKYSVSPEFVSQFNEVLRLHLNEQTDIAVVPF